MRPLVMDFRNDPKARNVDRSVHVRLGAPGQPGDRIQGANAGRSTCLRRPAWYDFWTGRRYDGGQTVTVDAPYDRLPLFVRAGSIVPVGPDQQYIGEKTREAITVYVYIGRRRQLSLYEDDGRTYGYERDEFSVVPLSWNEGGRTLTIGDAVNRPSTTRVFNVVLVSPSAAQGYAGATAPGKIVKYRRPGRSRDVLEDCARVSARRTARRANRRQQSAGPRAIGPIRMHAVSIGLRAES